MKKKEALAVAICLIVFILSNKWMSWEQGIAYMYGADVSLYVQMAETTPGFEYENMPYHIAQRFFGPFCAGLFSKIFDVSVPFSFSLLAALCAIGILICMIGIFTFLELRGFAFVFCVSLFILNPYVFRYHALVPGTLQALIFILGFSMIILGLFRERFGLVLTGIILGLLGRQTLLLILPGVTLWMLMKKNPGNPQADKKYIRWTLIVMVSFFVYALCGWVARQTGATSRNLEHMLGIFVWVKGYGWQWRIIAEAILRGFMPHVMALSVIITVVFLRPNVKDFLHRLPVEFWALLLMSLAIISQPIMAGPIVTGYPKGSGTRLGLLGVPSTIAALGVLLRVSDGWIRRLHLSVRALCLMAVFLGSVHHMYTWFGPSTSKGFFLLNFFSVVLLNMALLTVPFHLRINDDEVRCDSSK